MRSKLQQSKLKECMQCNFFSHIMGDYWESCYCRFISESNICVVNIQEGNYCMSNNVSCHLLSFHLKVLLTHTCGVITLVRCFIDKCLNVYIFGIERWKESSIIKPPFRYLCHCKLFISHGIISLQVNVLS